MSAAPSLVNVLRPHGDFAIIGQGGGVDDPRGRQRQPQCHRHRDQSHHCQRHHARPLRQCTYHLYQIPEVHIHVSDGRSFVRNSRERYDAVQMTLVDTWASTAAGAFALSENNLYTVEAFREYFEHLKPDGIIAITRWEFTKPREALRVVSQAMKPCTTWRRRHHAELHRGQRWSARYRWPAGRGAGEEVAVHLGRAAGGAESILGVGEKNPNLNLTVLYMPVTANKPGMAHPAFSQLIRGQDVRGSPISIPTTSRRSPTTRRSSSSR